MEMIALGLIIIINIVCLFMDRVRWWNFFTVGIGIYLAYFYK